jgi:hypothetical protein
MMSLQLMDTPDYSSALDTRRKLASTDLNSFISCNRQYLNQHVSIVKGFGYGYRCFQGLQHNESVTRMSSPYGQDQYDPKTGVSKSVTHLGWPQYNDPLRGCDNANHYFKYDRYKCGVDTFGLDVSVDETIIQNGSVSAKDLNDVYIFENIAQFLRNGSRNGVLEYTIVDLVEIEENGGMRENDCSATIRWKLVNLATESNDETTTWYGVASTEDASTASNRTEASLRVCRSTDEIRQFVFPSEGWAWDSVMSIWKWTRAFDYLFQQDAMDVVEAVIGNARGA